MVWQRGTEEVVARLCKACLQIVQSTDGRQQSSATHDDSALCELTPNLWRMDFVASSSL